MQALILKSQNACGLGGLLNLKHLVYQGNIVDITPNIIINKRLLSTSKNKGNTI